MEEDIISVDDDKDIISVDNAQKIRIDWTVTSTGRKLLKLSKINIIKVIIEGASDCESCGCTVVTHVVIVTEVD